MKTILNKLEKMTNNANPRVVLLMILVLFSTIAMAQFDQQAANTKAESFWRTDLGKKLMVTMQAILIIAAVLYTVPIIQSFMKELSQSAERQGEDEMSEKKKLLTTMLFKIGMLWAVAGGAAGIIQFFKG